MIEGNLVRSRSVEGVSGRLRIHNPIIPFSTSFLKNWPVSLGVTLDSSWKVALTSIKGDSAFNHAQF